MNALHYHFIHKSHPLWLSVFRNKTYVTEYLSGFRAKWLVSRNLTQPYMIYMMEPTFSICFQLHNSGVTKYCIGSWRRCSIDQCYQQDVEASSPRGLQQWCRHESNDRSTAAIGRSRKIPPSYYVLWSNKTICPCPHTFVALLFSVTLSNACAGSPYIRLPMQYSHCTGGRCSRCSI